MERIDPQQIPKKAIPAICEQHVAQACSDASHGALHDTSHHGDTLASHWLSSAMAIWLQDDNGKHDKGLTLGTR